MRCRSALGLLMLSAAAGLAQSTPARPQFDVASVKPSPPGARIGSMGGGPLSPGPFNMTNRDPDRITWTNVRLTRVLMLAWDLPADRISGPDWLGAGMYDIQATIPKGASVADFKLMVRNLLAERFHLAVHRETKEVSGYALEVAKGGPAFEASMKMAKKDSNGKPGAGRASNALMVIDASGFPAPRPGNPMFPPGAAFSGTISVNGRYRAAVLNESMKSIALFLGTAAGVPVEDQTGLTGTCSFHLEYVPNSAVAPAQARGAATEPGPDLIDAVRSQLGLKLVRQKVPVEMLVVDHIEKVPVDN